MNDVTSIEKDHLQLDVMNINLEVMIALDSFTRPKNTPILDWAFYINDCTFMYLVEHFLSSFFFFGGCVWQNWPFFNFSN